MALPTVALVPVIAYARVSTARQSEEGWSLEAQQARLEAHARLQGLQIVRLEVDAGVSAASLDRPGLQRALQAVRDGEAAGILAVKLDRLTRSVRDLDDLLTGDLNFQEGGLYTVEDGIDPRTPVGRLLLRILASVAQWERETTAIRTAAVRRYMVDQGQYVGGGVPYGWHQIPGSTHLEPDEREQRAIARATDLHARGTSLRAIGAILEQEGYRPRGGAGWNPKTVRVLVERGVGEGT